MSNLLSLIVCSDLDLRVKCVASQDEGAWKTSLPILDVNPGYPSESSRLVETVYSCGLKSIVVGPKSEYSEKV